MSEISSRQDSITINAANVVLQGMGSGGPAATELFFSQTLVPDNPSESSNYGQSVNPFIQFVSTVSCCPTVTTVASDAIRGTFSVAVTDASGLSEGMHIYFESQSTLSNSYFLGGLKPQSHWSGIINNGVKVQEKHVITTIANNVLHLAEPLLCNITAAHGWDVHRDGLTKGWGVRDLHFIAQRPAPFQHHATWQDDSSYEMILFMRGLYPYVLRSRFTDANNAVVFSASYGGTALLCAIEGNQAHSGFLSQYFSRGSLFAFTWDDNTYHGAGVTGGALGTVITRSKVR